MPKINILPNEISELIAAGEVVERPASVVKELIENSADAGATKITVEIMHGGIESIRITDDGCGIAREDVPTAFISHATSKIRSIADLSGISTMGFRGEALPSIAAVSRLTMLTKTRDEDEGTSYCIEGGKEIFLECAGCPDGTTIVVSDIFYNIPARMKFLKKDNTEANYVADVLSKAALAHPEISYKLIRDGRQTMLTSGDGVLLNAVYSVYGREFASSLIPIAYELNGVEVTGFISKPLACRPNRNMQHFFVNRRCVKIPVGSAALDEAYRNSAMVGKFPACVLGIKIAPETVDVNVHPAKTEVRFSDDRRIFDAIYYAAKSSIRENDTRPEFKFEQPSVPSANTQQKPNAEQFFMHIPVSEYKTEISKQESTAEKFSDGEKLTKEVLAKSFSEYTPVTTKISPVETEKPKTENINIELPRRETPENIEKVENSNCNPIEEKAENTENEVLADISESSSDGSKYIQAETKKNLPFKIVSEVFNTYIICEYGNKLLLIDKHALHERMLFDELKASAKAKISQLLLTPVTVTLSHKEYDAVMENSEVLENAGFAIEDFGGSSVVVRECPVMLENDDIPSLVTELAGYLLKSIREPINEKLDWIYHNTACRAAVKAGRELTPLEIKMLVEKFLENDELRYCPHGRPVLIEMSRYEIEKQFGRVQ